MKIPALQHFRERLQAGEPVYGMWVTLEAAAVTDIAVGLGLDWVVIDAEHSHLDWAEVLEHTRATARSHTVALVHIGKPSLEKIERVQEIGADGVLISQVESSAQLELVLRWSLISAEAYRLKGVHATTDTGSLHVPSIVEPRMLVIPVLRGNLSHRSILDLLKVEQLDVFLFDPSGAGPSGNWNRAGVQKIAQEFHEQRKYAGVIATNDADLKTYRDSGFRMLGVGFDGGIILGGIRSTLKVAGISRYPQSAFVPLNYETTEPITDAKEDQN